MGTLAPMPPFHGRQAEVAALDEALGHRYPVHAIRGWLLIELDRLQDARSSLSSGRQLSW